MKLAAKHQDRNTYIYLATFLLSILLSLNATLSDDLINYDGILYLKAAQAYIDGGLQAALALFSLPLFPILIGLLHKTFGLEIQIAGYLLNFLFYGIVSVTFVRLYTEISTSNALPWIPVIFILTIPTVNDYREYIIRDPGFWAFMLLSVFFFVHYTKRPSYTTATLWQLFAVLATLFRIEGVAYILLAPMYFLISPQFRNASIRHIIKTNWLFAFSTLIAIVVFYDRIQALFHDNATWKIHLSYMQPSVIFHRIAEVSDKVKDLMPLLSSSSEASLIVISGLLTLMIVKLITNIHPVYAAVTAYGAAKWPKQFSEHGFVVLYFAAISLTTLIVIVGNQFFLSSRYTVFFVLLSSLITCQYFERLVYLLVQKRSSIKLALICLFIMWLALDNNISTGASKENLKIASYWLTDNLPENSSVACNEPRFAFYSRNRCNYTKEIETLINKGAIKQLQSKGFDHFILWIKKKNIALDQTLMKSEQAILLKSFTNKKGDEARIYKIATS